MTEVERLLREHSFCAQLSSAQIKLLISCASIVDAPAGWLFFRQGEPVLHLYFVVEGQIAIELEAPPKGRISILTLSRGDILGWSWLTPPYNWRFDARALSKVITVAFDAEKLRELLEENHDRRYELLKRLVNAMGQRLESARLQLMDIYGGTE